MNKRMKNKMAKQLDLAAKETLAAGPVTNRVSNEIAQGVAGAKNTVSSVIREIKDEVVSRANQLEKKAEHLLEKVPLVGEAAAHKLAELSDKLQDKPQATV